MDNLAEEKFKEWLDKNKIPYWYIDQSLESFSPALKKFVIKRPDFLILLPNFGLIFVDVKNKEEAKKYPKFYLYESEVDKYIGMQRKFNIPIWFALSHEKRHYKTWFWIPVSDVTRAGFVFESQDKKGKYYSVPIEEFVQVSYNDNLRRIFDKLFES
jgi:hypothetical protein